MAIGNNPNEASEKSGFNIVNYIPLIAFGMFIVFGGIFFSALTPILFPPQASAEAEKIDGLFSVLLLIGGAIFLLVQGLLVFAILRYRARPDDTSDGPPTHGNMTLEIVWTIIPAIIVIFLVIYSYDVWVTNQTIKDNENIVPALGEAVPVTVVGQRYAWNFEYETPELDDEGNPVVLTDTYLHTYVGQNVKLNMETRDVIHSFWVPAMRLKQDLLPGRTTEVRFTPTQAGEYPIVCAELCGGGHGEMFSTIIVHPDAETYMTAFYEPAVFAALNPPADPVLLGEQVLPTYQCRSCHVLDAFGWTGQTGPSLNGIGARAGRRVSGESAEEYLLHSIFEPDRYIVPGFGSPSQMPQFGTEENPMPGEDLFAIVAYLCTETGGVDSDCDMDNLSTTIPDIIEQQYGLVVSLGQPETGDEPAAETTAEPVVETTAEPAAETTAEPNND